MKIKNKITKHIFNLPKDEAESLIYENSNIYEKISKQKTQIQKELTPVYEQNTILPLIWEE